MQANNLAKSIGAVAAGMVFIVVTHTATDALLEANGILPKGNLHVGAGLILLVLGYRAVFSVAGCYLTARLAPQRPLKHGLILGAIGLVMSTLGAIANEKLNLGPSWYTWTLVAISLPLAWLGGKLYELGRERRTSAATRLQR